MKLNRERGKKCALLKVISYTSQERKDKELTSVNIIKIFLRKTDDTVLQMSAKLKKTYIKNKNI